jgi:hypothetical protein
MSHTGVTYKPNSKGKDEMSLREGASMQKTASGRFTSIKKESPFVTMKFNKFSSSGVGNFQIGVPAGSNNNQNLPPFSPTPTTPLITNNSNIRNDTRGKLGKGR